MTNKLKAFPGILFGLMLLGCWAILYPPRAAAANEAILSAASMCAKLDWRDKGGYERAKTYGEAVDCFKALYIRVASSLGSNEVFEKELSTRLDKLDAAYYASRDVCGLQNELGINDNGCGTSAFRLTSSSSC